MRWGSVFVSLILIGLFFTQYKTTNQVVLIVALIITVTNNSFPLMLRQDPCSISTTSPLVEKVRSNLPKESRFAVVSPKMSVLQPNFNSGIGLASIHTKNSLSPKHYHKLINNLGGEMKTYGRLNVSISPDYNNPMFWMCDISLLLSKTKLIHENLEYLGEESGVHLSKTISRMGNSIQVLLSNDVELKDDSMKITDPRMLLTQTPSKVVDFGDVLEYKLSPSKPSVFILSQMFHRDWKASVYQNGGETIPARTVDINGVFQGVLIPDNIDRVRLEFKPFIRYMWVSHVFWLLLFAFLTTGFFLRKKHIFAWFLQNEK